MNELYELARIYIIIENIRFKINPFYNIRIRIYKVNHWTEMDVLLEYLAESYL